MTVKDGVQRCGGVVFEDFAVNQFGTFLIYLTILGYGFENAVFGIFCGDFPGCFICIFGNGCNGVNPVGRGDHCNRRGRDVCMWVVPYMI